MMELELQESHKDEGEDRTSDKVHKQGKLICMEVHLKDLTVIH